MEANKSLLISPQVENLINLFEVIIHDKNV